MGFDKIRHQENSKRVLLRYAVYHWGYHARSSRDELMDWEMVSNSLLKAYSNISGGCFPWIENCYYRKSDDFVSSHMESEIFHVAIDFGLTVLVQYIMRNWTIDLEYIVRDVDDFWSERLTALLRAVTHGYERIVEFLLEGGANPETKGHKEGLRPLHTAVDKGHETICRLLLDKGADYNGMATEYYDYRTALHIAAKHGYTPIAKMLLERGSKVDVGDKENRTPLSIAARGGHEKVVRLLVDKGADPESKDCQNRTPLSRASEEGCEEVVQYLLDKGAEIESKDDDSRTPLAWVCAYSYKEDKGRLGFLQPTTLLRNREGVVRLLLEKGAELETTYIDGRTPLSFAAEKTNEEAVRLLVKNGANLETEDVNNHTPLIWTCISLRKLGKMSRLVTRYERGIQTLIRSDNGYTFRRIRRVLRLRKIVRLLLDKGANLEAKDSNGWTPSDHLPVELRKEILPEENNIFVDYCQQIVSCCGFKCLMRSHEAGSHRTIRRRGRGMRRKVVGMVRERSWIKVCNQRGWRRRRGQTRRRGVPRTNPRQIGCKYNKK
jgi:ankyrin repeat protein